MAEGHEDSVALRGEPIPHWDGTGSGHAPGEGQMIC